MSIFAAHLFPALSFSTMSLRAGLICLAMLLGGCALLPAAPTPAARPIPSDSAPFALNGRISIHHQGERHSAGLRWNHQLQSDEILLLTPLGQTTARVYSDNRIATLERDGKRYQADDVESLMQRELGWHLPLGSLRHWLLGMAHPATPAHTERTDSGQIAVLVQDGWEVRYLKYADTRPDSLPARLQLRHEDMQVQLLIDEWDWNPR